MLGSVSQPEPAFSHSHMLLMLCREDSQVATRYLSQTQEPHPCSRCTSSPHSTLQLVHTLDLVQQHSSCIAMSPRTYTHSCTTRSVLHLCAGGPALKSAGHATAPPEKPRVTRANLTSCPIYVFPSASPSPLHTASLAFVFSPSFRCLQML